MNQADVVRTWTTRARSERLKPGEVRLERMDGTVPWEELEERIRPCLIPMLALRLGVRRVVRR